jgi:hypothetical protein
MLDPERGQKLALPPDQELLSDLTAPRWTMTMQGIKVEPKEDIVKRLGRSPDCADALVLAILRPPVYETPSNMHGNSNLQAHEQQARGNKTARPLPSGPAPASAGHAWPA